MVQASKVQGARVGLLKIVDSVLVVLPWTLKVVPLGCGESFLNLMVV